MPLTLKRRHGEAIVLRLPPPDGRLVQIVVWKPTATSARIVVDAPRDVHVFRRELTETPACLFNGAMEAGEGGAS